MRESLARAIHSTHLEESTFDVPLDKIKAIGIAGRHNPIGAEALHFFDALQAESYQRFVYLLASKAASSKYKLNISRDIAIKISKQVIKEDAFRFCHTCHGRQEIKAGERVITCHTCAGAGLHRHTDLERATALQIPLDVYQKRWARKYQNIQSIFTEEMKDGLRHIRKLLDRY